MTGHAEHGNSYHLIRKTDDLFFNLFKNELEGLTYGKITIRFARWKRRQVDEHKIQRESDQVDRGNPGHSQRPNGPGDREMITLKCFDAKEPSNTNGDRRSYGNNRYSQSNIDQWLNSQAASWYSARHSYDAPPNNANVWSNYNEYDTEAGFLSNFEADFRKAILDAVIRVAKNTVTDGGGYEDITRKVFLLSNTEVGLSNENGVAEGTLWSYFPAPRAASATRPPKLSAIRNIQVPV